MPNNNDTNPLSIVLGLLVFIVLFMGLVYAVVWLWQAIGGLIFG